MPIFAICLMAIMALVGATLALGMDSRSGHQVQQAADSAALGGATAFLNTSSPKAEVRLEAARAQATALASNNTEYALADLMVDAVAEDAYGQHTQLAVELEFKPVNYFSKFTGNASTAPIRRRAVAAATWGFPLCILTLDSKSTGVRVRDDATLMAENCIVWSNSAKKSALRFEGGKAVAKAFCTVGDVERDGDAIVSPRPETGCQALPDPLENFDLPISGLCDQLNVDIIRKTSTSLQPGIFCGGLKVRARNVTFEPGIYHIRGGGLEINADDDVIATGVTFVFDGLLNKIEIKGGSSLTVKAPATGPTAGIAFAQLKGDISPTAQMRVEGSFNVEGVIYLPSYDIRVRKSGGGQTKSPYLQIVANSLDLDDDGVIEIDFDMSKSDLPMVIKPAREARLVN